MVDASREEKDEALGQKRAEEKRALFRRAPLPLWHRRGAKSMDSSTWSLPSSGNELREFLSNGFSFPFWSNMQGCLLRGWKGLQITEKVWNRFFFFLRTLTPVFFLKKSFLFIYLVVPGLSCGTWTLNHNMWDLVPWPGIEPGPPALGAWNLSHWTTREVSWNWFVENNGADSPHTIMEFWWIRRVCSPWMFGGTKCWCYEMFLHVAQHPVWSREGHFLKSGCCQRQDSRTQRG